MAINGFITLSLLLQTIQKLTSTLLLPFALLAAICVIIKVIILVAVSAVRIFYLNMIGDQKLVLLTT